MLIKFFKNGKGGGAAPVDYLIAETVLAYDENRNIIRGEDGKPEMVTRDPLPDVMRGNPAQMIHLIDACPFQWSYRAGVISFAHEDAPTDAQQQDVIDKFEALAFSGLERDAYETLWVRHTHENRVELHFCTPRMRLDTQRSLNIAPPGYERAYDSLRDMLNKRHDWADPFEPERAQELKPITEAPAHAQSRDEVQQWIVAQIERGAIRSRADMIEALSGIGFEVPRTGKDYITVKDPETRARWRMKGALFHDDWTRAQTIEQSLERALASEHAGQPARSRRLDSVSDAELRERYHGHIERRTSYNRERSPALHQQQSPQLEADRPYEPLRAVDRDELSLVDPQRHSWAELAYGELDGGRAAGGDGTDYSPHQRPHVDPPQSPDSQDHQLQPTRQVPRNQGVNYEPSPTDSVGARIARLRRTIDDNLSTIRKGLARLGGNLEQKDPERIPHFHRIVERIGSVAARIGELLERPREQVRKLGADEQALARKLDATAQRRAGIEQKIGEIAPQPRHTMHM